MALALELKQGFLKRQTHPRSIQLQVKCVLSKD